MSVFLVTFMSVFLSHVYWPQLSGKLAFVRDETNKEPSLPHSQLLRIKRHEKMQLLRDENKRSLTMGGYFVNLLSVNQNSIFWVFMVWYLSDQFKNCIICEWQLRFCYCLQLTEPRFQIILPDIISTFSLVLWG